jgi:WD40 repeat protein
MLAFSQDEQVVFAGNPRGISRFWKALEIPAVEENSASDNGHLLWQPSGDGVMAALPENRGLAIGDAAGHVHVLPSGASLAEVRAHGDDVSFVGHTAAVVRLAVDRSGTLVASAAADNTVRVWDTESGQPHSWTLDVDGNSVDDLVFSPDAGTLAVLSGTVLHLFNIQDGAFVARFEFGELHGSVVFVSDVSIYVGVSFHGMVMASGRCSNYGRETMRSNCWLPRQEASTWLSLTRQDLRTSLSSPKGASAARLWKCLVPLKRLPSGTVEPVPIFGQRAGLIV